jgi:hypothetical protein
MYPLTTDRQWLSKNVMVATNAHETTEELLDASFSLWSMSYQKKAGF